MLIITTPIELFLWLHQEITQARPRVRVWHMYAEMDTSVVDEVREYGRVMGMAYEQWLPFFEGLVSAGASDSNGMEMSQRLTEFITELLADLAGGGESRVATLTQLNLMLIGNLGWADRFSVEKVKSGTRRLRLQRAYSEKMAVEVDIGINELDFGLSRFDIGE